MGGQAAALALSDEEPYDRANVVGVGIGEKVTDGVRTGRLAVKVLVKEKKPASAVSADAFVPQNLGGALMDVDETGEVSAQMVTARRRPVPCGASIGNCMQITAGTLGCLVVSIR